ncbi:MAG: nuclease-related domain-containing protein [Chloroflexota bacterium]|mgnify:FL=1|nr:MAG: hypothetical protein DIU68_19655 [Chloroflexota bacterium]
MRVVTNDKLVRRNRQIAQYLFFFSFGILILGLLLTNQQITSLQANDLIWGGVVPAIVVVIAFISTVASVRMTNLWIRQPRPETALREGLKGLSNKSVLYNYYHLPARHVLIAPQGVFVFTTRWQDGRFSVKGDDWQTHKSFISRLFTAFRFDSIGNPTDEAIRNSEYVRKLLEPIAPDVPVQPVIVFTDPRAHITIESPTVPVLRAQDKLDPSLKDYMRQVDRQPTLTPEQIAEFERRTLPATS